MPGFFDATCPACGGRVGWHGEISDRPACPACGHRPPQADLDEAARRFRAMMDAAAGAEPNGFRRARKGRGLTILGAARSLGTSPTALSAVEQGRTPPTPDLARRAADLYEVTTEDLARPGDDR